MNKTIIGIAGLVVLSIAAAIGFAQIKEGGDAGPGFAHKEFGVKRGMFGGPGLPLRSLALTDEQKAKVKEILTASKQRIRPLVESLRANRENLEKLTAAGNFDEKTVSEIASQSGQIISQMIVERERSKSEIYSLLTDEQKAKLAELKAEREARRKSVFSSSGNQAQ